MDHVDKKAKVSQAGKENNGASDFRAVLASGVMEYAARGKAEVDPNDAHFAEVEERSRKPWEKRITELLAEKLEQKVKIDAITTQPRKTEGDIPQLSLHSSFYVEGIRIGWPFPAIMPPQRQMALHLIKALKNRRHVVLESPTGTGKSAAILCSVLAWQRHHKKTQGAEHATPRIIYCSRTHSQVAQMVASLRKTPYRPKMTVLGSRDRLCIHKKIHNRGPPEDDEEEMGTKKRVDVTQECQTRVGNTEKIRKNMWKSPSAYYDDDEPPEQDEFDTAEAMFAPTDSQPEEEDGGPEWKDKDVKKPCCPHYRQLGTTRTADMAYQQLIPQERQVSCCTMGGEKTKLGSHDIEDLVAFGMDPYVRRDVAVYRRPSVRSFGMTIAKTGNYVSVANINPEGAIAEEGSIKIKDEIVRINGEPVRDRSVTELGDTMRNSEDPLLLDVAQESIFGADESAYSPHSPCPYYISRALAKHAELLFCPYNYVLDPSIRRALDIDLNGAVVVLDEAHNVEDCLRESGSGKFGEIELCQIVVMLYHFSSASKTHKNTVDDVEGEKKDVSDVAHYLLLFVEKVVTFLMDAKTRFEQNPGNKGAKATIAEWEKYHTPDNTEFQMTFDGPNGNGQRGKVVGCSTFFHKISFTPEQGETLHKYVEALEGHVRSKEEWEQSKYTALLDKLNELIGKFAYAIAKPGYYYVASVAKANGNLEFAAGMSSGGLRNQRDSTFKRSPRKWPKITKTGESDRCFHKECRNAKSSPHIQQGNGVHHGSYCNGSMQPWEAVLVLELLTPSMFMNHLAAECHSVILASGSLSPLPSLCGELGLVGASSLPGKKPAAKKADVDEEEERRRKAARLQIQPKPLEANHVINLEKQLLAVSIGHFADGSPLTMNYAHYSKPAFVPKLGDAIASVIEAIPTGGVLVFLPSYAFLRKCVKQWKPNSFREPWDIQRHFGDGGPSIWDRLLSSKGKVIVEPTGSQAAFEEARDDFAATIQTTGKCILLAVFRGKMSEGISFNDANARGVICVGIPFPKKEMAVQAKMDFNTEQRKLEKRTDLLPGSEWYSQQAYRAIAQALGRCIRHAADYGTVILMDSRHCDDGEPVDGICRAHRQLPKWMRHHVRNLSKRDHGDNYGKSIAGSWRGLGIEMARFFEQAPLHAQSVLEKQQETLQQARDRAAASASQKAEDLTPIQNRYSVPAGSAQSSGSSAQVTPSQATPNTPFERMMK